MRVFVTVGTTPFDRLIEAVDRQLSGSYDLVSQISEGKYQPKFHTYFRFTANVDEYYKNADIIISHGGAGSIFRLLELNKRVLIVPNLERLDHHQLDICRYMEEQGHAKKCDDLNQLKECLQDTLDFPLVPYQQKPFTGVGLIRELFGLSKG